MTDAKTKAVRLAAAAEAFAEGTGLVLVRELRAFLEEEAFVPEIGDRDLKPENVSAALEGELAGLRAEVERLTSELAKAKAAARQRKRRSASAQGTLFDRHAPTTDVTRDADLDLSGSNFTKTDQRSGGHVRHEPECPPPEFLELAFATRPDLPEVQARESFRRFARKNPVHDSVSAALEHWRNWYRGEKVLRRGAQAAADEPPPAPPPSEVDPGEQAPPEAHDEPVRAPPVSERRLAKSRPPPAARAELAAPATIGSMVHGFGAMLAALGAGDAPIPRSMSA